ncbi:MAG: PAS domain S-box protein [Candidatus Zixiibacteriota bacterium]
MIRRLSLRNRLSITLAGAALLAYVLASTAILIYQQQSLEDRAKKIMEPYAQMVFVGAEAAIAFQDSERALEILKTLQANPQILEAEIFLNDGQILANLQEPNISPPVSKPIKANGVYLSDETVELIQSLPENAHLRIVMSLGELNRETENILLMLSVALFILLVILYIGLLVLLQRVIVQPVSALAEVVNSVRIQQNYRQHVPASGTDEVSVLGHGFNAMMEVIQKRDNELHQLNRFQQAILDNAAHCIVSVTPDGVISSFNPAAERLLGYEAKEVIGKKTPDIWHVSDEITLYAKRLSEEIEEEISSSMDVFLVRPRHNLPEENEWTYIRKDGSHVPVFLSISPLRDEKNKITGFVGLSYDLSERKRAEEEQRIAFERLKTSESRLADAQRIAKLGNWEWDIQKDLLWWSNETYRIFGKEPGSFDVTFESFIQAIHPDDQKGVETSIKDALNDDSSGWQIDYRIRLLDNSIRYVHEEAETIFDQESRPIKRYGTIQDVTELKIAEEALKEKHRQLLEAQRIAHIGNWWHDLLTGEMYWSDEFFRILGIEKQTPTAEMAIPYIHPDDLPSLYQAMEESAHGKREQEHDFRIIRPDGQIRWIHNRWVSQFDKKGKELKQIGTHQDITERKLIEEALRESEDKYSKAFHSSPLVLSLTDIEDGRILEINDSYTRILGFSREDAIGHTTLELGIWCTLKDREIYVNTLQKNGCVRNLQVNIRNKDGQKMTIVTSAESIVINKKRCMLVTFYDITERIRAEEDLKIAKENWELTFNAVDDLIFIQDINGHILQANKAMLDRLGLNAEQVRGIPCHQLMHDNQHIPKFCPRITDPSIQSKRTFEIKEEILGGQYSVSVSPIIKSDGGIIGWVHVARDITEVTRLQELESRAERLHTAGRIAGQVAHDLNNLLMPITAYPDIIRDLLAPDDPSLEFLTIIEEAGDRISEINQQLLTLSRRGHYNQDVLNLNRVVEQVLRQLGPLPESITCIAELESELTNIIGGAAQLHRMLLNLIVNARDALQDSGTILIRTENIYLDDAITLYSRIPKGEYAVLTIIDDGPGIPEDIIGNIFEPFFSTKSANRKRGSGLGLSVVDAVIKDHNGYIDLKSEVGQGTSFYLYFPVTHSSEVKEVSSDKIPTGQESILIVDDDPIQRAVLSKLLSSLGYQVTGCENGEIAIDLLKNQRQDLLLLDMIMPGSIDGVETFRLAREINPEQQAIIVSGYSDSDKIREIQALGAGAFIKKPVNRNILANAVRKELDKPTKSSISSNS